MSNAIRRMTESSCGAGTKSCQASPPDNSGPAANSRCRMRRCRVDPGRRAVAAMRHQGPDQQDVARAGVQGADRGAVQYERLARGAMPGTTFSGPLSSSTASRWMRAVSMAARTASGASTWGTPALRVGCRSRAAGRRVVAHRDGEILVPGQRPAPARRLVEEQHADQPQPRPEDRAAGVRAARGGARRSPRAARASGRSGPRRRCRRSARMAGSSRGADAMAASRSAAIAAASSRLKTPASVTKPSREDRFLPHDSALPSVAFAPAGPSGANLSRAEDLSSPDYEVYSKGSIASLSQPRGPSRVE